MYGYQNSSRNKQMPIKPNPYANYGMAEGARKKFPPS